MTQAKLKRNDKEYLLYQAEFMGIFNSLLNRPSSYRPYEIHKN